MNDTSNTELDAQQPETFEHMITVITTLAGDAELAETQSNLDERDAYEEELWKYANSWWEEQQDLIAQREQAAELRGRIDELVKVKANYLSKTEPAYRSISMKIKRLRRQATKPEKEG